MNRIFSIIGCLSIAAWGAMGCTTSVDLTPELGSNASLSEEGLSDSNLIINFQGDPPPSEISIFTGCIQKLILNGNGGKFEIKDLDQVVDISPTGSTLIFSDFSMPGSFNEITVRFKKDKCDGFDSHSLRLTNRNSINQIEVPDELNLKYNNMDFTVTRNSTVTLNLCLPISNLEVAQNANQVESALNRTMDCRP